LACAYAAASILAVSQDSRLDPAIGGCLRNHGETPSSTGLVGSAASMRLFQG
jgi:hypothetical protein